jgi:glutamine amidotransferase
MVCDRDDDVVATLDHDGRKTIAVASGSVFGVQFHPEKSHRFGMRFLSDFARVEYDRP